MLSLVIPTFNESGNIAPLVSRIAAALDGEDFEVIIADDASPDGTAREVLRLQRSLPWLRLIERTGARDLSRAVVEGWRAARGDLLGCMDADLQHPPELLPALLALLRDGPAREVNAGASGPQPCRAQAGRSAQPSGVPRQSMDVVIASRYVPGATVGSFRALRHAGSRAATALVGLFLPASLASVSDPLSGYFLLRRDVLTLEALRPRGYKILIELLARCRPARVAELPFAFGHRAHGSSKAGPRVLWELLFQVLSLSRTHPRSEAGE